MSLSYEEHRSQAETSAQLGASRSIVSRLLQDAERRGMVEVQIAWPMHAVPALAERLTERFDLVEATGIDAGGLPYPSMLRTRGAVAAAALTGVRRDEMTISIAWGTAPWETIRAFSLDYAISIVNEYYGSGPTSIRRTWS